MLLLCCYSPLWCGRRFFRLGFLVKGWIAGEVCAIGDGKDVFILYISSERGAKKRRVGKLRNLQQ